MQLDHFKDYNGIEWSGNGQIGKDLERSDRGLITVQTTDHEMIPAVW
jgi:hypothetical protein